MVEIDNAETRILRPRISIKFIVNVNFVLYLGAGLIFDPKYIVVVVINT